MHVLPSKLLCYPILHPVMLSTEYQRPEMMESLITPSKGGEYDTKD